MRLPEKSDAFFFFRPRPGPDIPKTVSPRENIPAFLDNGGGGD